MFDAHIPDLNRDPRFLEKIHQTKPVPKALVIGLNMLKLLGIALAFFIGFLSIGIISLNILSHLDILTSAFPIYLFLELFLVFAISIGAIYWIYSQTDWVEVKYNRMLLVCVAISVAFVGTFVALGSFYRFLPKQEYLEQAAHGYNQLPFRGPEPMQERLRLQDRHMFVGKIQEIKLDGNKIIVKIHDPLSDETRELFSHQPLPPFLEPDQFVAIRYQETPEGWEIVEIRLPPKPAMMMGGMG